MWDRSRPEFAEIFDRTSQEINLEGCTTPLQINRVLNKETARAKVKAKLSKVAVQRAYMAWVAEQLDKLIHKDFSGRAIYEANRAPREIIAQTLVYGRVEARKRVLAMKRDKVRSNSGFKIGRDWT